MIMYRNSIRISSSEGDKFGVKGGVCQGSVLNLLLFIVILGALLR